MVFFFVFVHQCRVVFFFFRFHDFLIALSQLKLSDNSGRVGSFRLGASNIFVKGLMGIGCWAWGDTRFWGWCAVVSVFALVREAK